MTDKSYAIFDMDGTLLDSMPYWRNILSEYLQMPIDRDYAEKISNMTVTESVLLTHKTFNIPKSPPKPPTGRNLHNREEPQTARIQKSHPKHSNLNKMKRQRNT